MVKYALDNGQESQSPRGRGRYSTPCFENGKRSPSRLNPLAVGVGIQPTTMITALYIGVFWGSYLPLCFWRRI